MGQLLGLLWRGEDPDPVVDPETDSSAVVLFAHSELRAYPQGIANFLGRGGFGSVWIGTISGRPEGKLNGLKVAIKESRNTGPKTRIQWEAERQYLPRVVHPNIIKLIGYCETQDKFYLVYPFMPNGSVQSKLSVLDWSRILKIIKGAARAIQALHGHTPPLVYRGLKPDNLLLDKHFNPKLADFGNVTEEGERLQRGTSGYTDPIVMSNGLGTRPNDIYSLGVVILQLIMKEKVVSLGGKGLTLHITDWAKTRRSQKGHAVDEMFLIKKECSQRAAMEISELALDCVQKNPLSRPTIAQVLQRLATLDGSQKTSRRIQPKLGREGS